MFLVDSVPDPHLATLVSTGNVEPTGAVLGNIDLGAVLGVDVGHLGGGKVPDDDTVTMAVQECLTLINNNLMRINKKIIN